MSKRVENALREAVARGVRGPNANGEYSVCCPFCEAVHGKEDNKYKLQLNPQKNLWHCYRHDGGGYVDLSWMHVALEDQPEPTAEEPPEPRKPEGFLLLADYQGSVFAKPYLDYLRKRDLLSEAFQVGAGFCARGRYTGRVIIPHKASAGPETTWLGFAARAIYEGMQPKYLYPRGMDRKGQLWGGHLPATQDIYLVEGVFDALALCPAGVASFGKNVTEEQLDMLAKWASYPRDANVFVCLDGDAWQECQAVAMRLVLRDVPNVRWCKLPPTKDPGELKFKVRDFVQYL